MTGVGGHTLDHLVFPLSGGLVGEDDVVIFLEGFGLLGVWFPMALDWTMRCLLMTIRYRRGKWKAAWKTA